MPRFIVVHTATFSEQTLKSVAEQARKGFSPGTSWNRTYCDFDDNKFFCEWEAHSKEELEQLFSMMTMPFDTVYPVRLFNVAKGTIED